MGGAASVAGITGVPELLRGSTRTSGGPFGTNGASGNPFRALPEVVPDGLVLRAREGTADVGGGVLADGWMLNDSLPSPLIRVRRGDPFRVTLRNELKDDLILHWHGLTPPQNSDGHPRFAVGSGSDYEYDFTVQDRAGTYWYHSHAHMKVGEHSYRGIGGMIIVEDDEEDRLELPSGERDIPVILQDRKIDPDGRPIFDRSDGHLMDGYMGPEPFGNGVHRPHLDVDSGLYRLRILNGSNARIFHLERSDGGPMVVIGNDGGLLERSHTLSSVLLAPAERVEVLLDLGGLRAGDEITLRSRAFAIDGKAPRLTHQGEAIDLLGLRVVREVSEEPLRLPDKLATVAGPDPARAARERTFQLTSDRDYYSRTMMSHQINGRDFRMDQIDERVPFGQTEVWNLVNDSGFAHPMHIHATHFRVLSREGGRGRVMPWEEGLKDTVLVYPDETVRVAVQFTSHRGLFLIHCHNLEHEDVGMILNVMVD